VGQDCTQLKKPCVQKDSFCEGAGKDLDEVQDWSTRIGGTDQDANASRIIVGAALAVWYPSLIKSHLAAAVAPQLVNSVMAVNGRHSATTAELLLAEGMESTWQ